MKNFESFLAPQLNEYLAYRQGLGYRIRVSRYHLLVFDRYLRQANADWNSLQPFFFLEMRAHIEMEPRDVNRVLSSVRVFFHFLVRREYVTENPLQDIPFLKENTIVPFVFSPDEIEQLLGAMCRRVRKTNGSFLTDLAIYLAVVLLARCGMRISEPLGLLRQHYRRDDATLYIEKTKFKKQRLIPLPQSVAIEIENYLSVRSHLCPADTNPYLLAGKNDTSVRDYQVRSAFHHAVHDIGLAQPRNVIGTVNFSQPTPHSLRHSFAVNTLQAIEARGKSPQHALPVLAAYMR
jgi:integrase/recombinase XerD